MITSLPGVVDVQVLRGAHAPSDGRPGWLVEVPHGADEARDYDALRARLKGPLPVGLDEFFWINTDVGAWAYGLATARALVARAPDASVLLVRSRIPRTFIDCNRPADFKGGDLASGALTAGLPAYVKDADDVALLLSLHAAYVDTARQAFALVCGNGGTALVPHTYGPRTLGIDAVDDAIVQRLHEACDDGREASWPLRPEIDLVTRDARDEELGPAGMEAALLTAFRRAGFDAQANETYRLTPGGLGYEWSLAYPGRVFCLEVRRDRLVEEWRALRPMTVSRAKAEAVAAVLVDVLASNGRSRSHVGRTARGV